MTDSGHTLNSAEVDFLLDAANDDKPPVKNEPEEPNSEGQTVTMRGDLEQINLSDIFQTLAMTKMEGMLLVRNPLEQRQVFCCDGYVRVLMPARIATRRLGQRLLQAGLLQPEQLRAALVQQRKEKKPIGQLLVDEGIVTVEQIEAVVNMQVAEDLFSLFTWRHGTFEFWKGEIADPTLRAQFDECPEFEVSSLLLEVARRSDEWESILAAIGNLEEVPQRLVEVPAERQLSDEERALIGGADGRASFREIAEQTTLSLFDMSRAARDLVRDGTLGKVPDATLVATATAEADAGHHKRALVLLQTLRDRPGERPLEIVRSMVEVLVKASERRLAGLMLLELAQVQTDPEQALEMGRKARALAPQDAGITGFLRRTLLAHSSADATEVEQYTVELLDALIEEDRLDTAMEILEDARATNTRRPQVMLREARILQKRHDPTGAANVLFELAQIYQAANNRAQAIETYSAILRLDRSRRDVVKLLRLARQTRAGRIVRAVAATICACLLAAMGIVFWHQTRFEAARQAASSEIEALLGAGDRANAREALTRWASVMGECESVDDLRQQVDFAEAAEQARVTKLARKRLNERLITAAELLGTGSLREAIVIYDELHRQEAFAAEITGICCTRIDAVLTDLEQTAKAMQNRLPAEPSLSLDAKELSNRHKDLDAVCRPALRAQFAALADLQAKRELPAWLPDDLRIRIAAVLGDVTDLFRRATKLVATYAEAIQRNSNERRLDPMFKLAIQREEAFDFRGALELFRQLERERAGDAELRAHFRDQVAKNATICRLMDALEKATHAGDFAEAQAHYQALKLGFQGIPFERIVRLPLQIDSAPPGALVTCNGTEVGKTPCRLAVLPADENTLGFALPGFRDATKTITGDNTGSVTIALLLQPDWMRRLDNLIDAPPLSTGNEPLVLVDRGGNVSAINRHNGEVAWTFRSGDLSGLLTVPVRYDGILLVASLDGTLRALDQATGNLIWSLPDLRTEVVPVRVDGTLVLATTGNELVSIDLAGRSIGKRVPLPGRARGRLLAQGRIVLIGGDDGLVAVYTLPGMEARWRQQLPRFGDVAMVVADGSLVVADDRGHVAALAVADGQVRWQRSFDAESFGPPRVETDCDAVWLATPERIVRCRFSDGGDGPEITRFAEPWCGPPVRVGSRLLAPARDGTIHVMDFASCQRLYGIEGAPRGAIAFACGQSLLVMLPDRRLLAFDQLR